ncbi:hypothetical protein [Stenotrophomonas pigmentata]|uniref:hypothetical protein n=1 Tax=Stenotrophomonas pigmentata TaxID=3055080 RepID=UPI0026EF429D|nr:hypothetical protein [Stenotrophomonas sp. 610A2]
MKTNLAISLAICLLAAPFIASAENFPRQNDRGSVDSVVVAAIEAVEVSKRALIDYGVYDMEADPAKWTIMQIAGRGHNMQRGSTPGLGPMYSMRFIMDRVRGIESQVVSTFHEKRAIHCVLNDESRYEALPGTVYSEEVKFCLSRPDWKAYEATPDAAGLETEVGSTAR